MIFTSFISPERIKPKKKTLGNQNEQHAPTLTCYTKTSPKKALNSNT
jgi:hypothetical protein